jgi:hypothetical protein
MRIIHQNPQNFIHKQILVDSKESKKILGEKKEKESKGCQVPTN